jgi:flagellar motor switch protein FliM
MPNVPAAIVEKNDVSFQIRMGVEIASSADDVLVVLPYGHEGHITRVNANAIIRNAEDAKREACAVIDGLFSAEATMTRIFRQS